MRTFRAELRDHWRRARSMERFVKRIVGGGVGVVAGLWLVTLFELGSIPWALGVAIGVGSAGSLGRGIWSQVDY